MASVGELSKLIKESKRLVEKSWVKLQDLERHESSSSSVIDSPKLSLLKKDLSQIQSLGVEMDRLWRSVPEESQRRLWRRKVEGATEEAESLKASFDKYLVTNQHKMNEAREREALLGRHNGESSHILRIFDEEAQAMQSARNSSKMIEEAYSTGVAILTKYSEQRDHLKRAQRKALDILNTVGLSNTVLKVIERRHRGDKWIKYIGMALTTIIVFFFWRWTR